MRVLNLFLILLIPATIFVLSSPPYLHPSLPRASSITVSCVKSGFLCMFEQKGLCSSPPPFAVWQHTIQTVLHIDFSPFIYILEIIFYQYARSLVHEIHARIGSLDLAGSQGRSGSSPGCRLLARAFLPPHHSLVVSACHSERLNSQSNSRGDNLHSKLLLNRIDSFLNLLQLYLPLYLLPLLHMKKLKFHRG